MTRARLLWVALFGIVAILVTALILMPLDWRQVRVQQAAIAAVVVAAGWFAAFLLREFSQQLGRSERLRDVHRALKAEIGHYMGALRSVEYLTEVRNEMLDQMEGPEGFIPFVPRERNDTVFQSIVGELHILPRSSIEPVVAYYSQLAALDTLIDDMRGEGFKALTPRRRAQIYSDYINLKAAALDYGTHARAMIDLYHEQGWRAADAAHRAYMKGRSDGG
ncbi:hypothetical protein [Chachezhania antarctica]|uniref:hypothetical protein n=1 Tax=Chachezhania antarctica TaxID=2340860 RepID=UPI000EB089E8|nr:hypothetical protein [Chachezhania antarctica]|tara:strand:+ start:1866 stop:2528 length:663 start_codon:yes stop_codon:yes gene_type:complete